MTDTDSTDDVFVTCPECGREMQVWPHPDRPNERPEVVHFPGDTHRFNWDPSDAEIVRRFAALANAQRNERLRSSDD